MKKVLQGFTLIEVLVAVGILGVMMVLISSVFTNIVKNSRQSEAIGKLKIAASPVQEIFLRQVRGAAQSPVIEGNKLTVRGRDGLDYVFTCDVGSGNDGAINYKAGSAAASNLVPNYQVASCAFDQKSSVFTMTFTLTQSVNAPQKQEFSARIDFETSAVRRL